MGTREGKPPSCTGPVLQERIAKSPFPAAASMLCRSRIIDRCPCQGLPVSPTARAGPPGRLRPSLPVSPNAVGRAVTVTRRLVPHTPHRLPTLCGCVRLASEPRAFALVRWRLRVSHNAPVSPLRPFVGPRPGGSPPESPRGPLLWCTAAAPHWRPKSANRIFLGNVTLTPCKAGTPPLEDRFVLRSRLSHTTFVMRRG